MGENTMILKQLGKMAGSFPLLTLRKVLHTDGHIRAHRVRYCDTLKDCVNYQELWKLTFQSDGKFLWNSFWAPQIHTNTLCDNYPKLNNYHRTEAFGGIDFNQIYDKFYLSIISLALFFSLLDLVPLHKRIPISGFSLPSF